MKLNVYSLKGVEFEGEAAGLNVKTTTGEVTILDHHRPLVTVLAKGTASVISRDGKRTQIAVNSGFLEMSQENELNVLVG